MFKPFQCNQIEATNKSQGNRFCAHIPVERTRFPPAGLGPLFVCFQKKCLHLIHWSVGWQETRSPVRRTLCSVHQHCTTPRSANALMSCGRDSRDPDEIKKCRRWSSMPKNLGPPSSSRVTHADVASSALTSKAVDLWNPFVRATAGSSTKLCQAGPTLLVRGQPPCRRRPPLRSSADAAWT